LNRVLAGATDMRLGEGWSVLAAALLFFLMLAVVMVLRPVATLGSSKNGR
jgi:hypothetical protein